MADKKVTIGMKARIMVSLHIPEADAEVALEIRKLLEPVADRFPGADLNVSLGSVRK